MMAKLLYSMLVSLDGYTEDAEGKFGWGAPEDPGVHAYINELAASVRTYLYGRRMYETMLFWETFPATNAQAVEAPAEVLEWARQWKSAQKVVFSRTLPAVRSENTRLERDFDPAAVRRLIDASPHDLSVDGPGLAAQALAAGLVDEIQIIQCPVLVGGGKRFFPDGVSASLTMLESRVFDSGVVYTRYSVRK